MTRHYPRTTDGWTSAAWRAYEESMPGPECPECGHDRYCQCPCPGCGAMPDEQCVCLDDEDEGDDQ